MNKPTEEDLEATETEALAEDDPIVMKPPFPNESDDSSAHILVKVQDCDPPAVSWEPPHNCRENSRRKYLLLSAPMAIRPTDQIFGLHCCPH